MEFPRYEAEWNQVSHRRCIFLTCVVRSQPSSRLTRTDEPVSRSSPRNSASWRILCSCWWRSNKTNPLWVHQHVCLTKTWLSKVNSKVCPVWLLGANEMTSMLLPLSIAWWLLESHCIKPAIFVWFVYLLDPLRVLQGFKEGVFGVGWGGAGGAGPQQLFKGSLHLPCFCKLHRHQFTVQRRVHSKALQTFLKC